MVVLILFILILLAAIAYGMIQLYRSDEKPRAAIQSAVYVVVYPIFAYLAWIARPIPLWLLAPLLLAALPWLFAGVYLNEIVKDPTVAREGEFVGFPYGYWVGGGVLSIVLGILLG